MSEFIMWCLLAGTVCWLTGAGLSTLFWRKSFRAPLPRGAQVVEVKWPTATPLRTVAVTGKTTPDGFADARMYLTFGTKANPIGVTVRTDGPVAALRLRPPAEAVMDEMATTRVIREG